MFTEYLLALRNLLMLLQKNMQTIAREVAHKLLQINAIKLNVKSPFTWASGLKSPIYCDNRLVLSYPEYRSYIVDGLVSIINEHYHEAELIAGVATGAIAPAALVADRMQLPMVYVRSQPKSHGLESQIEGFAPENKKTVIIEDLISTAKSSISAFQTLKTHGLNILGMAAIFTYDLDTSIKNLQNAGCILKTLTNYHELLSAAQQQKIITQDELKALQQWRLDPAAWSNSNDS